MGHLCPSLCELRNTNMRNHQSRFLLLAISMLIYAQISVSMPAADTKVEEEEAALLQALKEVMSDDRYPMFIPAPQTRGSYYNSAFSPRLSRSFYDRPRRYGAGIRLTR